MVVLQPEGQICASGCPENGKKIGIDSEGYVPARFWKEEWRSEGIYPRECPLSQWAQTMFQERRPLVFVGAAGIAVRAIAPFVRDKFTDPPVLVIDEGGTFCIPLLSGHVGGANRLARKACQCLGAIPVIATPATDVNGLFAVDEFAVSNGLIIAEQGGGKTDFLPAFWKGSRWGYFCDLETADERKWSPPPGCIGRSCAHNIWITYKKSPAFSGTGQVLRLIPRCLILGIGCRRGVEPHVLEQCVMSVLEDHDIDPQSVRLLATIDRKKEERAILFPFRNIWMACHGFYGRGAKTGSRRIFRIPFCAADSRSRKCVRALSRGCWRQADRT